MEPLLPFKAADIEAVWTHLDERTQLAIYVKILEQRVVDLTNELNLKSHQIETLEQAVKQPQLDYTGVKVA